MIGPGSSRAASEAPGTVKLRAAPKFAFKVMVVFVQVLAILIISLASSGVSTTHLPFNPREYPKKVVSCPAVNRAENTHVDIELRTYESSLFLPTQHHEGVFLIRNIRRLC